MLIPTTTARQAIKLACAVSSFIDATVAMAKDKKKPTQLMRDLHVSLTNLGDLYCTNGDEYDARLGVTMLAGNVTDPLYFDWCVSPQKPVPGSRPGEMRFYESMDDSRMCGGLLLRTPDAEFKAKLLSLVKGVDYYPDVGDPFGQSLIEFYKNHTWESHS